MMYGRHVRLEDRLADHEPPYRSRGEAQVGRLLDRYGIPFFYEQPTLIYDRGRRRVWLPDFSLPSFNGLLIEYAGMPDVPEYAAGVRYKARVYDANALPVLFVYPEDLRGPRWPERLYDRIRQVAADYGSYLSNNSIRRVSYRLKTPGYARRCFHGGSGYRRY